MFNECETAKTSNVEGTRFVTVSQIGIISVPQFRVGIVGHAMQLVDNHINFVQFKSNCTRNSQNCAWLCLVQFLDCY